MQTTGVVGIQLHGKELRFISVLIHQVWHCSSTVDTGDFEDNYITVSNQAYIGLSWCPNPSTWNSGGFLSAQTECQRVNPVCLSENSLQAIMDESWSINTSISPLSTEFLLRIKPQVSREVTFLTKHALLFCCLISLLSPLYILLSSPKPFTLKLCLQSVSGRTQSKTLCCHDSISYKYHLS